MQACGRADQYVYAGLRLRLDAVRAEGDGDVPGEGILHHSVYAGTVSADGLHVTQDEDHSLAHRELERPIFTSPTSQLKPRPFTAPLGPGQHSPNQRRC